MAKKIGGVKVPKRILGLKLRKGTRKDIAALVKALKHPDGRALAMAAMAAFGPLLAERIIHKPHRPKTVK